MRFVGIILILLLLVGFALLQGALGFLDFWYLLAVVAGCQGALFFSERAGAFYRSLGLFFQGKGAPAEVREQYATLHEDARGYSLAAGVLAMLLGMLATLCGDKPPRVHDFAAALSGPIFGLLLGYLWHHPMGRYFREKQ